MPRWISLSLIVLPRIGSLAMLLVFPFLDDEVITEGVYDRFEFDKPGRTYVGTPLADSARVNATPIGHILMTHALLVHLRPYEPYEGVGTVSEDELLGFEDSHGMISQRYMVVMTRRIRISTPSSGRVRMRTFWWIKFQCDTIRPAMAKFLAGGAKRKESGSVSLVHELGYGK